jgi:hypothetical protein
MSTRVDSMLNVLGKLEAERARVGFHKRYQEGALR